MTQITILKVEKEKAPKGYVVTSVSYKTYDGKVKGMKIYPFGDQKSVADAFADAKSGDVYEAEFQKNAKDFWEFKPVPTKTGATEKAASPAPAGRSNWETSEERAARQVLIVRQSSAATATNFVLASGKEPTITEVIEVAKQIEAFVMGREPQDQPTGDVE